jgi:hypothetical protein
MNPKAIRLAAIVATCLVVLTGINRLLRPPTPEPAPQRKSVASNTAKEAELPCAIKHATFGGTQASLLKVMKGRMVHYVILDHPAGDPVAPFLQLDWLEATYGTVQPVLIGAFPTVDGAVMRAASLCRRN